MSDTESKNIPAPRREWSVTSLAIEVFSIVLGVLLALGLSEWSEERQHRQQADIALGNVLHEIRGNQTTLDSIHANNSATLAAMSAADPDDTDDRTFVPGLQLQETAWNAFLSTGLSNYAPYEDLLTLSRLYAVQDVYKQTGRQLVESSMTMAAYAAVQGQDVDDEQFQIHFLPYFQMLTGIEEQLLLAYENALDSLGKD